MARKALSAPRDDMNSDADDEIVKEAQERFRRAESWESNARTRFVDDYKFAYADSDNKWQWPETIANNRDLNKRPMLTINKTRQYNKDITNDARQNKPAIKIKPVGDEASYEGAQVMEGIVRRIEYQSNAQAIYDQANDFQVSGGWGAWRIVTRYADDETFDQDIFLAPIPSPLNVYTDPMAQQPDKSDMGWGFVFDDIARDEAEREYKWLKGSAPRLVVGDSAQGDAWITKDTVRRCEYYRVTVTKRKLIAYKHDESGETLIVRDDHLPAAIVKGLLEKPTTKTREVDVRKVEWFKIVGEKIVERKEWPGSTVPIVIIVGEEIVVEGEMDRKSHTRYLKDPQRMLNYWSSGAVEHVALQSKSPFIGPAAAIEGFTDEWSTANTENLSIIPYNHRDDEGREIPPPQRSQPPTMAPAYMQGMQMAYEQLRTASGQYQADLGEPGNERSGVAIQQRQRSGDNATYHFVDNQALGIKYSGRIIAELIPIIYDTPRIVKILGEDGIESRVRIDPNAEQEIMQEEQLEQAKVNIIFNPSFAKYSVEADIGPAYATRRQEAFAAFTQIIAQNPALMQACGDLMFKAADFPMADQLAERLKRMVPPHILGEGPDPQVQELLQTNQELMGKIQMLVQQAAMDGDDLKDKSDKAQTDAFRAETDRMKVLFPGFSMEQLASMTAQLVLQAMNTPPLADEPSGDVAPIMQPAAPMELQQ